MTAPPSIHYPWIDARNLHPTSYPGELALAETTEMARESDVVIIGGGHNGLVSACSLYSYLISLFPQKIVDDLGLNLQLRSRKTASWTPSFTNGTFRELLIRNDAPEANREAFHELTGDDRDYEGYLALQEMQQTLASLIWPSLTEPLVTRDSMRRRLDSEGQRAWEALIEEPLGKVIEELISDDLIRGLLFTDAKIGIPTFPHDPSLLQNRCFLYHVIGRGTGEWRVPVGGMGALTSELTAAARATGKVTFATEAKVSSIHPGAKQSTIEFETIGETNGESQSVVARYVLCNASAQVLAELTGEPNDSAPDPIEGTGFKINMLLERLPKLRSTHSTSAEAFAGTFHIDEGYEQMLTSYQESMAGNVPTKPPGEIYCHTLTDDSILSEDLRERGYHTLTLFGLDLPYRLFQENNDRVRNEVLAKYLSGINEHLEEPIEDCLARDAHGNPCIEAMSPVDLEKKIHLPKGNIFHGDLTWPFTDDPEEAGQWGVETSHPNIFLCGSAAKRGGAVSGIPGHNAAMKILELEASS